MKKLILSFALLSLTLGAFSQIEQKIIGKWEVYKVETTEDKLKGRDENRAKLLEKASLQFTEDHHAKFKQIFTNMYIPDGIWEYNAEKEVIIIKDEDDLSITRMRLWFEELEDGTLKLWIDETPFIIYVSKIQ